MEEISLCGMTRELCHELFKLWENDPDIYADMERYTAYHYDKDAVDRYFEAKQNPSRVLLAIMKGGSPVGEIEPFPQKRTLKAKKKWRDMRRG